MKQNSTQQRIETFSLAEARGLVKDLFKPNPTTYWADFLITMAIGLIAFRLATHAPGSFAWRVLAFVVCALAYYRASIFTHELVHLPSKSWKAFRIVWNLLCGIPFLMPSFTYYCHVDHHRRKHYGTFQDGEYMSLGAKPAYHIFLYLLQPFFVGPLAVFRYAVLAPLSWICPPLRRFLIQHASSLVMDPTYIRPLPPKRTLLIWRLQEALCCAWVWGIAWVVWRGVVPISGMPVPGDFLPKIYLLSVAILMLNGIRTMAAHRFVWSREEELSFAEQMVDSINHPDSRVFGPLWAPVGQRYHALHHLFPSLPYHNLATAHQRLMEGLPGDSAYRLTVSPSLVTTLRELWSNARRVSAQAKRAASEAAAGVTGGLTQSGPPKQHHAALRHGTRV